MHETSPDPDLRGNLIWLKLGGMKFFVTRKQFERLRRQALEEVYDEVYEDAYTDGHEDGYKLGRKHTEVTPMYEPPMARRIGWATKGNL